MANIISTQILNDGPKNTVVKLIGQLDTADEVYTIKVDPATLSPVDTQGSRKATSLRIVGIQHNIEDGLTVNLWWDVDGTQPNAALIESLEGRDYANYHRFGGLTNVTPSATGKIALSTQGWGSGLTLSYSVIITLAKKY